MAVSCKVEDLLPGMTAVIEDSYGRKRCALITSLKVANWPGTYVREAGTYVQLNGEEDSGYILPYGSSIRLVPTKPTVNVTFDLVKDCWKVDVTANCDVLVLVDGTEVGDGVVYTHSARVKELEP